MERWTRRVWECLPSSGRRRPGITTMATQSISPIQNGDGSRPPKHSRPVERTCGEHKSKQPVTGSRIVRQEQISNLAAPWHDQCDGARSDDAVTDQPRTSEPETHRPWSVLVAFGHVLSFLVLFAATAEAAEHARFANQPAALLCGVIAILFTRLYVRVIVAA